MRGDLRYALRLIAAPTIALLAVAAIAPGRLVLAGRIYALVFCAVAVGLAVAALRRTYPPAKPLRTPVRHPAPGRVPPPSLARIEHEAALGVAGAFDLHYRLAPRIRSVAAGLLSSRRMVSLDASSDDARRILGDETWNVVRPDRPLPEDRLARGLPPSDLRRVVESLEGV